MSPLTRQQAASLELGDVWALILSGFDGAGVSNAPVFKVNAGSVAPGQSLKSYVGKTATSTTVVTTVALETVPALKTFYMTDIVASSDAASGSATTIDFRIQAGGVDVFRQGLHNLSPINAGLETQPVGSAGSAVTLLLPITGAVQNVWYYIGGFEQ